MPEEDKKATEDESVRGGQKTPQPSRGVLALHGALSLFVMGAALTGAGAVVPGIPNAVNANFYLLAFLRGIVVLLLILSIYFGGKGIQALVRFSDPTTDDERTKWLKESRKCFSYQVLILIPAALVWVGSLF